MLQLSDLPDDYCPGHIYLLSLGIHVELKRFSMVYFSGLQCHGGTTPTPPAGVRPPASALRVTVVGYPSIASFEGEMLAFSAAIPSVKTQVQDQPYMDKNAGQLRIGPEVTGTA
jgi:hypothetical protein